MQQNVKTWHIKLLQKIAHNVTFQISHKCQQLSFLNMSRYYFKSLVCQGSRGYAFLWNVGLHILNRSRNESQKRQGHWIFYSSIYVLNQILFLHSLETYMLFAVYAENYSRNTLLNFFALSYLQAKALWSTFNILYSWWLLCVFSLPLFEKRTNLP